MIFKRKANSKRARRPRVTGAALAIEVSGGRARLLRGERDGDTLRVEGGASEALAPETVGDAAAIGAVIAKLLEARKIKPAQALMAVPRPQLVLRNLSLPRMADESELATLIYFQIARDLPFRVDEAAIDFKVLKRTSAPSGEDGAGKAEVLVAAAQRSVIDFHNAIAQAAGLKLAGLGIQPDAHARAAEGLAPAGDGGAVALVSAGPSDLTVDVASNGDLLFSRNASLGHHQAETSLADISTIEVVRTLHSYGGSAGAVPVTSAHVSGSTGFEGEIAAKLAERLGIPCSSLRFDLKGAARESDGVSPATVGLLLQATEPAGLPFDLLSPKKPAPPRNTRRTLMIAGATAAVLLLIGVFGTKAYLVQEREEVQKGLTAQLAALTKDAKIYRAMTQQAKVIDDWAASGRDWLAHYAHLSSVLPPSEEIYISAYSVAPNGTIRMGVQARSGEVLARAEKQLRDAGYVVKPVAVTPTADRFGYEFRSNVEIIPSRGQTIDLAKAKVEPRPADDASLDPAAYKKGGR